MNLLPYVKARYPILYLVTPEEGRAELAIQKAAQEAKYKLRIWSHFMDPNGKNAEQTEDPIEALIAIKGGADNTIYVARDLQAFFSSEKVVRLLRDIARDFKQTSKTLIITSPVPRLPKDLERDVTLLEFDLPQREEIEHVFNKLYEPNKAKIGAIPEDERERIVQAAMGLTTVEAENALAKAVVESVSSDKKNRPPISKLVLREKALAVRKSGILRSPPDRQRRRWAGKPETLADDARQGVHPQGARIQAAHAARHTAGRNSRLREVSFCQGGQQHLGGAFDPLRHRPRLRRPGRRVGEQHAAGHTDRRSDR